MPGDNEARGRASADGDRSMPWGAGDRILDFSIGQAHLALRHEQLVIRRDGHPDVTTPIAEAAVVVLASRMVTCTLPALDALMRHGAAVIVCDESMHPSGMMLPLTGHAQQTRRMIAQARANVPVRKRLWQEIVSAKVRAQGTVLRVVRGDDGGLHAMSLRVKSGDPENVESQAAQRYWPLLFNDAGFVRRRDAADQNRLLNYGYAVLRAAVGRAIVASGLHPSLGVHHHGRENPYCLADDLMEPYRPLVDAEVVEIAGEWGGDIALGGKVKERLVGVLHGRLPHPLGRGAEHRTVFEWIARSAASLARILCGESEGERLFFPEGLLKA